MKRTAFTLIELLVVIAIIVALLAILMPAMARAIATAQIAVCQSNQRQIAVAWATYSSDHLGRLVGSHTGVQTHAWVASPGTDAAETADHIRNGKLWSYLNVLELYRCPADLRSASYLRSYSINMYIGGIVYNEMTPASTVGQIVSPSGRLLTLDEADPRKHNRGAFGLYPSWHSGGGEAWIDWPAPWHLGDGNTMTFADGHSGLYRFRDPATAEIASFAQPAPNSADLDYYQSIYCP